MSVTWDSWRRLLSWGLLALGLGAISGCGKPAPEVVVYCAQDQVYAEPILTAFTAQTGIRVRPLYDSEAVKTVGLANRLIAERSQPQCDVFWGNEELRTRQLVRAGVLSSNDWGAFGFRSRRIVVNTNRVAVEAYPRSLTDLTNAVWRGKVALGYPLFGTTATHFAALRQLWGPASWEQWCRALVANAALVVDGNSVTARLVAKGEASAGLTDSDDIAAEQRAGGPVIALPIGPETLLIPNTVALTANAPHPEAGRRLMAYLRSEEVVSKLMRAGALEGGRSSELANPVLQPDWQLLVDDLPATTACLKEVFLR